MFHPLHWYTLTRMNNRTHRKLLIVDSQLVSVGSTNFDNRSFRLNDEANLKVCDAGLAAVVERVFGQDLRRSRRVTLAAWTHRPWHEKVVERFSSIFASQM
jgi:cardiolipin synthase